MNINLTLIGQLLSFAVFVWFTMKYVWTPIMGALETRKKEIADGLAAAERGQHEQELAKERAKDVLHEAKAQAAEIVAQAQKRAAEIVDESKDTARVEGDRILTAAQSEIEQEANRAREQLREKVGMLAVAGAEKILKKEISADAHQDIVTALAKEI
ncbi:MAG: F0F1 ATP synthase subunit B [gamma proteobacterium symbiont of Stewartia floridana]|uniref:ATP synthase subunit b n=1 Tax=Candidatus Thiodiazotropha taylori TaxID=2792791 RepID=A0A9E4U3F3_9GAMM|nr:F0F1 ATP synthase subunit B [Candidatus Thiodiazotropha taylori]MBW9257263.1 F0F1 ATP synthase subunit B [Candidatus Thiodiazotropha sp. (ex. Lucinisca nassula)]MCG7962555.1 F0F1 ATP synthase subunit B [Candidatus Thiodiazotropha endolucinida]MCG8014786.1 F0F1 ATP synthase subunit B [Candidatus Thiodiazotropha sp. 'RUGA']RLW54076.1 MAG: F0F1 ATP synthase subunit B [gamma proteobacterium symbiont of Stewartia floridana]